MTRQWTLGKYPKDSFTSDENILRLYRIVREEGYDKATVVAFTYGPIGLAYFVAVDYGGRYASFAFTSEGAVAYTPLDGRDEANKTFKARIESGKRMGGDTLVIRKIA